MLAWSMAVFVSLLFSLLVPLWLVWPFGVLISLYLLDMRRKSQALQLADSEIFWILVGVLTVLWCRFHVFLGL